MRGTVVRRRTVRPRRRRLAAEQLLETQQRAGKGVRLPGREAREKRRELLPDRGSGRAQHRPAVRGEGELLAAAVGGRAEPADEARCSSPATSWEIAAGETAARRASSEPITSPSATASSARN